MKLYMICFAYFSVSVPQGKESSTFDVPGGYETHGCHQTTLSSNTRVALSQAGTHIANLQQFFGKPTRMAGVLIRGRLGWNRIDK